MKVRADQLDSQLKKDLSPLYIISGDEILLSQEAADSVRKASQHYQIEERLRFVVDAQFDWQEIINELQSLSLFSTRRLFDVQIDKMSEKHSKALGQLSQSLNEDNVLLLTLPKLDARTQKTKWFTQLESQGVFVQVWPIDNNRLGAWVQQKAKKLGLSLTHDAANIVCERGEGNLLALSQELEKLALIHGTDITIDAEKIIESVADSSRYSIYDLSDRLLLGKTKEAMHCLSQLNSEEVEENILLWLFNREIQTLSNLFHATQSSSFRQACQAERIWDKRMPFYESALSRHNHITLPYMQNYLALMDKKVKGLEGPDTQIGFRNLVMMFCGYKPSITELDLPAAQ